MTIYLDTCALNRLTDDLSQPRIRREAEAVARILELIVAGKLRWITSTVLRYEIDRNPDPIRRLDTLSLLRAASETIEPSPEAFTRASVLTGQGFTPLDALHLAAAEKADIEWFLTTDDRFLHRAQGRGESSRPQLVNPVDFLERRYPWRLPHPNPSAR